MSIQDSGDSNHQAFLEPLEITQGELAKTMGIDRKTVNELCDSRHGVTVETAFCWQRFYELLQSFG